MDEEITNVQFIQKQNEWNENFKTFILCLVHFYVIIKNRDLRRIKITKSNRPELVKMH